MTGGVAQDVGLEFKPQYQRKKEKTKSKQTNKNLSEWAQQQTAKGRRKTHWT
jgi:hypothetical protein